MLHTITTANTTTPNINTNTLPKCTHTWGEDGPLGISWDGEAGGLVVLERCRARERESGGAPDGTRGVSVDIGKGRHNWATKRCL